jgi:hypothetical protein
VNILANFDNYNKVVEQIFELNYYLTFKLEVTFNTIHKKINTEIKENFHSEYVVGANKLTTNLRYKYQMRLSPRGEKISIVIDWDNYDDLCTVIEEAINICDPENKMSPFKRLYSTTGDLLDIKCDSLKVRYLHLEDRWNNKVDLIPFVLVDDNHGTLTEAIRFRFNNDLTFDVPVSRLKGFRRFLMTYNPVLHAGAMARYMAITPLLGSNRQNMLK